MKISLKIFVFTYCVMMLITIFGGFLLIHYEYQNDMKAARETAMENNEILYTYAVMTEEMLGDWSSVDNSLKRFASRIARDNQNEIIVGKYEDVKTKASISQLQEGECQYVVVNRNDKMQIQVISQYQYHYMVNYHDITEVLNRRDGLYELYRNAIVGVSAVIAAVLYAFSWYITKPLVQVTQIAKKLSEGDYTARVDAAPETMKSQEVLQLGQTLNQMADATETYIKELKETAKKKEDFMGNFAHEIKTPMTSIIGYADLLRTYDLQPEKRREYSSYIYTEGKRIEELSEKLLQLIVLDKKDFAMRRISAEELFGYLEKEVRFLSEKYEIAVSFHCEAGVIWGEQSLLLVAIKNLIDNACKASEKEQTVKVRGKDLEEGYQVQVLDEGRGIAAEEMKYIFEPFYMGDKSRTGKQGAGLGLSLCSRILQLHEGEFEIESEPGQGTKVTLLLPSEKKGETVRE